MPPIMAHSNEGQDHKDKYFDTVTRNDYVQYGSSGILSLRSYEQCHFFFILVKCQGQKIKYLQKYLITRDIHVKYQSSSTHYS